METLSSLNHQWVYRIERLWTPCGMSYIVQCLHKDVLKPPLCKLGVPAVCVLVCLRRSFRKLQDAHLFCTHFTLFPSRSCNLVKRLRAPTQQQIPEMSFVALTLTLPNKKCPAPNPSTLFREKSCRSLFITKKLTLT